MRRRMMAFMILRKWDLRVAGLLPGADVITGIGPREGDSLRELTGSRKTG